MAELQTTTTSLLVISLVILTVKNSTGKSVTLDLNLAPEWKAEITQRASDYGNLNLFFFAMTISVKSKLS